MNDPDLGDVTTETEPTKYEPQREPDKTDPRPPLDRLLTMTPATCGRVVHLYSDRWDGPRPGLVIHASTFGALPAVDVNVSLHGVLDEDVLTAARGHASGNTLTDVLLYDALAQDQRDGALLAARKQGGINARVIAEWPPRS